jgi:putative hemolysin
MIGVPSVWGAATPTAPSGGFEFNGSTIGQIILVLVLLLLAAFLAMSETALMRMSRIRASSFAEDGRRGGATLKKLVEKPEHWLHPVLFFLLICHLTIGFMVPRLLEEPFGSWGILIGIVADAVVVFVGTELVPKDYAVKHTDKAALFVAGPINLLTSTFVVRFIQRGLHAIANAVVKGEIDPAPSTSEQELLAMADAAHDEDIIQKDERSMIHSIIEFGDTVVREVMKPRTDMITVEASQTIDEAMAIAIKAGFSRIPVIRESKDDIAGLVYAKDMMRAQRDGKETQAVSSILRPARFAPESKHVSELMREMQAQKFHMAIVLDEYGGTAGLVTLEDLIEELIGEIVDEFDVEEAQIERLPDGDLRVTAGMLIDELNELLEVEWPSADWDTVGGLLYNRLGHVPHEGESVDYEGHRLRAERVKGRRIGRVRITRQSAEVEVDDE